LESSMEDFFPIPGNLCRLTEFTCVSDRLDRFYISDGRAPPRILAEPERVSLRKLIVDRFYPSLANVNVQDLEHIRLTMVYHPWPEAITFISQCHSLTTLITTDLNFPGPAQPHFTLPNLMYLHTVGFAMLEIAHTPNLRTLVIDKSASYPVRPPSLPALTTLCVINVSSEGITSLLALNTSIRRLILSDCYGVSDLVRLLRADDTGSATSTLGTMLLPSLSLLQVCNTSASSAGGFHLLFACRPTLRIEHGRTCGPGYIDADELKEAIEESDQNEEPGVFEFRDFKRRI